MEVNDNLLRQKDELETLQTIFSKEFTTKPQGGSYEVQFRVSDDLPQSTMTLSFNFPPNYPGSSPPVFQLSAPWLTTKEIPVFEKKLLGVYEEMKPDPVVFQWIEVIRNECESLMGTSLSELFSVSDVCEPVEEEESFDPSGNIKILSCTPVTDRKSKFQAFVAEVHSLEDVSSVLKQLKLNKKIATATHNMFAYRIFLKSHDGSPPTLAEGREDDGEGGGGDKILYVLQVKNSINLMVVVTRWFGGINLGQARFKHITNCTTTALQKWENPENKENSEDNFGYSGKSKLRTSEAVYNQIKWDPEFDQSQCVIGFMDRFEGMQEIPFEEWSGADIPFHRVWYFKLSGQVVWDRKNREDLLKV